MGRRASYRWDKREQCYRTDSGGGTKYFRGIARDDHQAIAAAFAAHLADLDSRARPPDPIVYDLCIAFVRASRGVKPRTVRGHRERLAKFCTYPSATSPDAYGDRKASSMTATDLKRALRAWADAGLTDHYRAGICRSVKAMFRWAASEEGGNLIATNPMAEVKGPSVGHSRERYAPAAEVAAFLRFAWRRANAATGIYRHFGRVIVLMMRIAAHTGARPGDLCSAWWSDYNPKTGRITIPADRQKTGHTTKKARVIFLSPILVRAINRLERYEHRHPIAMFTHKRGKGDGGESTAEAGMPWGDFCTLPDGQPSFHSDSTPLAKRIREIRREAIAEAERRRLANERTWGLDMVKAKGDNRFVMYLLRHTTASDHLMGGGNPSTVAELLGTSMKMLETSYGHLLHDHLSQAAEEFARNRRKKK